MTYKQKYRQGWPSYDCDSFDHLDKLYQYSKEQEKRDYIKSKLVKPKRIRTFDNGKLDKKYISIADEAMEEWRKRVLREVDEKLEGK